MQVLPTTLITLRGEIRRAQLKLSEDQSLNIETLKTYFRKKSEPTLIGTYFMNLPSPTGTSIHIIGYKEGKTGTENKYVFPAPFDKTVLFGDVVLIASEGANSSWTNPTVFLPTVWEDYIKSTKQVKLPLTNAIINPLVPKVTEDDEVISEVLSEAGSVEELGEVEEEESEHGSDSETSDVEVEYEEEEEAPPPVRRKKKQTPSQLLSGYQQQNILLMAEEHNELKVESVTIIDPSPDKACEDYKARLDCYKRFTFLIEHGVDEVKIRELEKHILIATLEEAKKKHIFAHWANKLFEEIFIQRQRRLFSNLHPKSPVGNIGLLKRVTTNDITMSDLAYFTDIELFPENWTKLKEVMLIREQKWLEGNTSMKTDKFRCSRCGKSECSYYEMQTRSADEPMTIFITCLNCNKRWRN
jgi:DNA-directed RNA polymerase subunit M/transcription elongation factor TFIIS